MESKPKQVRIFVIGSGGAVGQKVCAEVARQCSSTSLVLGDHRIERAKEQMQDYQCAAIREIDRGDPFSIGDAIDPSLSAVIVCVAQEYPMIQKACLKKGVPCIDVTIEREFIKRVHELNGDAIKAGVPLLTMAGMWPGLSGLMAIRAASLLDRVESIDLALCQSTQSSVGPSGLADMMGTFSRKVEFREGHQRRQVPGFSVKRQFDYPEPLGRQSHRLVDFEEGLTIANQLRVQQVNLWTGFDSSSFDKLISMLRKMGILRLFVDKSIGMKLAKVVNALKELGRSGKEPIAMIALAHGEADGRSVVKCISLQAPSDYGATAMSAVAFARLAVSKGSTTAGAGHPQRFFQLDEVLRVVDSPELNLSETETSL